MGSSIQGFWFSSWYVISIDTGHIAHSPASGPRWSPAFKTEPVLSVSSFNKQKSEPLLQKVYRPVFSFESHIIISFSFCCPHIPENLPQVQLKSSYLLLFICLLPFWLPFCFAFIFVGLPVHMYIIFSLLLTCPIFQGSFG